MCCEIDCTGVMDVLWFEQRLAFVGEERTKEPKVPKTDDGFGL